MPDNLETGFNRFLATPASFRINKTAGGSDDGGGASLTLDVSDVYRDEAYAIAKLKGKNVEIVWRIVEEPIVGAA